MLDVGSILARIGSPLRALRASVGAAVDAMAGAATGVAAVSAATVGAVAVSAAAVSATAVSALLASYAPAAYAEARAAAPAASSPLEAYDINSKEVQNIPLSTADSAKPSPLEQMHHNIVHSNVNYDHIWRGEVNLNELGSDGQLACHDQLNQLITRPIVVCDHPDQLSHVILNRRYFNSLPEQYLLEAESDLNRLAQHNPEFKERLQEHGSARDLRSRRHEFESLLLQDYAQRRAQDRTNLNAQLSDYYSSELARSLHLENLQPYNQHQVMYESNLRHLSTQRGATVAQEAAAAITEAEQSITTPLKLKLQELESGDNCPPLMAMDPELTAKSLELFKAAAAAADPEAFIAQHGISNIACGEGCTHHNPLHSGVTPYFTFVTGCCWSATVPPTQDNNEFYVLFSNDCLNTKVEINILPHSPYTLPFLAQHVFTTLKEGERNHTYSNVQLTVHHHGYLITYDVLGVANAHFLTTSGSAIAMVVITGDLLAGVDYVNTFKRSASAGQVLPPLAIPEINRHAPTAVYTELQDLPFALVPYGTAPLSAGPAQSEVGPEPAPPCGHQDLRAL